MSEMGKHSTFTVLHKLLLAGFAILGVLLTPLAFLVMFLTVNDLLGPYMDGWAWVVPLGTEVGFMGLFLADILLEAKGVPAAVLHLMPYLFAALSLWLNVEAARGHTVGMVGHSVLPLVFFGYLLAAKLLAKRLSVSEHDRRRKTDVSDAIAHAKDILRAADRWWRFRAPVLLRRQVRSGRLPAAVLEAIEGGASRWEPVLEVWITRSLALPEGVAAQLAAARSAASQVTLAATPEVVLETDAAAMPKPLPETAPEARSPARAKRAPERTSKPALKLAAARSRSMSPDTLAEHVVAMLEEYGNVSLNRVKEDLHVGTDKAKAALEIATRRTRGADVVPIERRA